MPNPYFTLPDIMFTVFISKLSQNNYFTNHATHSTVPITVWHNYGHRKRKQWLITENQFHKKLASAEPPLPVGYAASCVLGYRRKPSYHRQVRLITSRYHCYISIYLLLAISRSSQCSTTGVTKAVVCIILSVGWCI